MGEGLGLLGLVGTPMPAGRTVDVLGGGGVGEGNPNPAGL